MVSRMCKQKHEKTDDEVSAQDFGGSYANTTRGRCEDGLS